MLLRLEADMFSGELALERIKLENCIWEVGRSYREVESLYIQYYLARA